jgi:hypothetical protein
MENVSSLSFLRFINLNIFKQNVQRMFRVLQTIDMSGEGTMYYNNGVP